MKDMKFGLPYGMGDESLCMQLYGAVTEENMLKIHEKRKEYFKSQPSLEDHLIQLNDFLKQSILRDREKLLADLKLYIESTYYPIYDTFDGGHNTKHIEDVIARSFQILEELNDNGISKPMVYVIAALHDIGMKIERKNHSLHSMDIVLNDKNLERFFTKEEIQVIATAVKEHSTSLNYEPTTIYGKIVADADKDNDWGFSLIRAYEYASRNFPNLSEEDKYLAVHKHLNLKFGNEGIVKFWIPASCNLDFLDIMSKMANDYNFFEKNMRLALTNYKERVD